MSFQVTQVAVSYTHLDVYKRQRQHQRKAGDDFIKKIVLALAFVLLGSFMISGCSKDEILNHYNNIVQSAGVIELTGKLSLEGTKEKGIDDYTGTYTADYENFSDSEYLFGGTSIKREAGKDLSIDCTLEVADGIAYKQIKEIAQMWGLKQPHKTIYTGFV